MEDTALGFTIIPEVKNDLPRTIRKMVGGSGTEFVCQRSDEKQNILPRML